jgi:hypothetical protein
MNNDEQDENPDTSRLMQCKGSSTLFRTEKVKRQITAMSQYCLGPRSQSVLGSKKLTK